MPRGGSFEHANPETTKQLMRMIGHIKRKVKDNILGKELKNLPPFVQMQILSDNNDVNNIHQALCIAGDLAEKGELGVVDECVRFITGVAHKHPEVDHTTLPPLARALILSNSENNEDLLQSLYISSTLFTSVEGAADLLWRLMSSVNKKLIARHTLQNNLEDLPSLVQAVILAQSNNAQDKWQALCLAGKLIEDVKQVPASQLHLFINAIVDSLEPRSLLKNLNKFPQFVQITILCKQSNESQRDALILAGKLIEHVGIGAACELHKTISVLLKTVNEDLNDFPDFIKIVSLANSQDFKQQYGALTLAGCLIEKVATGATGRLIRLISSLTFQLNLTVNSDGFASLPEFVQVSILANSNNAELKQEALQRAGRLIEKVGVGAADTLNRFINSLRSQLNLTVDSDRFASLPEFIQVSILANSENAELKQKALQRAGRLIEKVGVGAADALKRLINSLRSQLNLTVNSDGFASLPEFIQVSILANSENAELKQKALQRAGQLIEKAESGLADCLDRIISLLLNQPNLKNNAPLATLPTHVQLRSLFSSGTPESLQQCLKLIDTQVEIASAGYLALLNRLTHYIISTLMNMQNLSTLIDSLGFFTKIVYFTAQKDYGQALAIVSHEIDRNTSENIQYHLVHLVNSLACHCFAKQLDINLHPYIQARILENAPQKADKKTIMELFEKVQQATKHNKALKDAANTSLEYYRRTPNPKFGFFTPLFASAPTKNVQDNNSVPFKPGKMEI